MGCQCYSSNLCHITGSIIVALRPLCVHAHTWGGGHGGSRGCFSFRQLKQRPSEFMVNTELSLAISQGHPPQHWADAQQLTVLSHHYWRQVFGLESKTPLGIPATILPEFEHQFCSQFQRPAAAHPGRQQVVAKASGSLPPTQSRET